MQIPIQSHGHPQSQGEFRLCGGTVWGMGRGSGPRLDPRTWAAAPMIARPPEEAGRAPTPSGGRLPPTPHHAPCPASHRGRLSTYRLSPADSCFPRLLRAHHHGRIRSVAPLQVPSLLGGLFDRGRFFVWWLFEGFPPRRSPLGRVGSPPPAAPGGGRTGPAGPPPGWRWSPGDAPGNGPLGVHAGHRRLPLSGLPAWRTSPVRLRAPGSGGPGGTGWGLGGLAGGAHPGR